MGSRVLWVWAYFKGPGVFKLEHTFTGEPEFNSGVKFPSRGWNTQETAAVYGGQKVTEYYGA